MKLRALLLAGLLVTLPAQSAWAGMFDDEVARKQIAELQQSLAALTQRLAGATQNQIDFANQNEAFKTEIARLRGQVEELAYAVESAHKRQQDFYVDLDNRLRKLESAATANAANAASGANGTNGTTAGGDTTTATATGSETAATPPAKADPQAEMRDYETALGHLRESRFKEAQLGFEAFIGKYPQSAQQPSAHYWLGYSLSQQRGFLQAAAAFGKVPAQWPKDAKAPEALWQQANALVAAKDVPGAIKVLETLIEKYPTSPSVEDARARLKTLAPKKKR